MRKLIFLLLLIISVHGYSQEMKLLNDTTVVIRVNINQFRFYLSQIEKHIDSKSVTKEILDFFIKNAVIDTTRLKNNIK